MKRLILLLLLLLASVPAFASVNVLSGNLSHQQALFTSQGSPLPLRMALKYNSFDRIAGQVGTGWSHSYEIYLHENSDGTLVLTGGVSKRFYFPDGNGNFVPRTADYSSLTANSDGTYTINFPSGSTYQFASDKKLSSISDRHGNSLNFDYSVTDQLTVSNLAGHSSSVHFDANGRVDYVQDPAGAQFDLTYNANGQLETVTYPEPQLGAGRPLYTFNYTADGLLEYISDPNLQISKYEYTDGKVTRTVAPEGVIDTDGAEVADPAPFSKTYAYNSNSTLSRSLNFNVDTLPQTTVTEKDGQPWIYLYNIDEGQLAAKQDPLGNLIEYSYYPSTDSNYGHRQYSLKPMESTPSGSDTIVKYQLTSYNNYDTDGNPLDISTKIRTITYAADGTPDTPIDGSDFRHLTYTYGSYNRPTSITDVIAGTSTSIDYLTLSDNREQVTITAPKINAADTNGPQTVLIYRTDGQLDEITDPLQRTVDYQYDGNGVLTSITDPNDIVSTFSNFDALGLAQTVTLTGTDGTSTRATNLQYDALAQLIQITQGAATPLITEFDYDGVGNRNYVLDAEQNETTFEHNSKGQATKITNTLNPGAPEEQLLDTILDYQGAGCPSCGGAGDKPKGLTDARQVAAASGIKTMFGYDALGRLERETDQLGKVIGYTYYTDGRLKQKFLGEPGNGTLLLTYEYTADGKLEFKKDAANNTLASYSYYANGRLQTAATPDSNYTLGYYDNGWLKSVDNGSYIIEYQYDALGRRELVEVKQGLTTLQSIDYVYDATTKELKDIVSDKAGTFSFGYDAFGRRSTLDFPNGVVGTYSYDNVNQMDWLTGIDYTDGATGTDILNVGYPLHDKVGNRKQRVENGLATDYQYDSLYRVTQAKTGPSEENFTYDEVGNRESGPTAKDTPAVSFEHNAANQMLQGRKYTYDYDDFGNQSHRYLNAAKSKYWQYSWTAENQLQQALLIKNSQTLRTLNFKYDAFGRRFEKEVIDTLATTTTTYVYDGEDIVLQLVDDGATVDTRQYLHGPGIDEPLAQVQDGQNYFYHADGLGSVLALTDGGKNIVQRYTYDTFGMLTSILDSEFGNAYTYTAREWDRELGLYYYRARYYDPMEGRFIGTDPIGIRGNIYNQGVNASFSQYVEAVSTPYLYTGNDPVNYTDPFGLVRWDGTSKQGAAVVIVGASVTVYELTSEWVGNKRAKVKVWAVGPAAGVGAKLSGTVSGTPVEFYDHSDNINPDNFNGWAFTAQAGVVWGIGGNVSKTTLGHVYSDGAASLSGAYGFDESAMISIGSSTVMDLQWEQRCQ